MSSAQPASRPTSDSPVGPPIREAAPTGAPFHHGYYDPDSSSYDDVLALDAARHVDGSDASQETRELAPA
jgi:hypothetical protein